MWAGHRLITDVVIISTHNSNRYIYFCELYESCCSEPLREQLLPAQYYSRELLQRFEHQPHDRSRKCPHRSWSVDVVSALCPERGKVQGWSLWWTNPEAVRASSVAEQGRWSRRGGSDLSTASCSLTAHTELLLQEMFSLFAAVEVPRQVCS